MHFKVCVGLSLLETISRTAEEAPGGSAPFCFSRKEDAQPLPFLCSFEMTRIRDHFLVILSLSLTLSSDFQPLCHDILVCYERSSCVPLEIMQYHLFKIMVG